MLAEVRSQRSNAVRAMGRWKLKFVAHTFDAWASAVTEATAAREAVMLRAAAAWNNASVGGALRRWASEAAHCRECTEMRRRVLSRLLNSVLVHAFDAWTEHVVEVRAAREQLLRRATARLLNTTLVHAFEGWQQLTRDTIAERAEKEARALQLAATTWKAPVRQHGLQPREELRTRSNDGGPRVRTS